MLPQDNGQEVCIGRVALFDDLPVAYQSTFDFGVVDFVSKLRIARWGFASPQDLGVRFKQTNDLRRGGHTLFFQDTLRSLGDDLLNQRAEFCQLLGQVLCAWIGIVLQHGIDLLGLA